MKQERFAPMKLGGGWSCQSVRTWEVTVRNVLVPFFNLGPAVVVPGPTHRQVVRENKSTERVTTLPVSSAPHSSPLIKKTTHEISTVGVQLTSIIVRSQIQLRLVQKRDNLKVRRRAEELYTRDGALRDQPCASSRLRAPRDFLAFRVANRRRARRRCPHAPIYILKKRKRKNVSGDGRGKTGKRNGGRASGRVPSIVLMKPVWQSELWPSVVELQML